MRIRPRALLATIVCLCLAAPGLSALFSVVAPGPWHVIVICHGSELSTVMIDADGEPVDGQDGEASSLGACLLGTALMAPDIGDAFWERFVHRLDLKHALRAEPPKHEPLFVRITPARAPPLSA